MILYYCVGSICVNDSILLCRVWDAKDVGEDLLVDDGPPPPIPIDVGAKGGAVGGVEAEIALEEEPAEESEPVEEDMVEDIENEGGAGEGEEGEEEGEKEVGEEEEGEKEAGEEEAEAGEEEEVERGD